MTFDQATINVVIGVFLTLLGWLACMFAWFAKEMYRKLELTHGSLVKLKEDLPSNYVLRTDLDRLADRLESKLDRFFDLLQKKQDKE